MNDPADKPERPNGPAFWLLRRIGLGEGFPNVSKIGEREQNNEYAPMRIAKDDLGDDKKIEKNEDDFAEDAGVFLSDEDGDGFDIFDFVVIDFVDMFAEQGSADDEPEGDGLDPDGGGELSASGKGGASNHEGTPDDEGCDFSEGDFFEDTSIKETGEKTRESKNDDNGATPEGEHDHDDEIEQVAEKDGEDHGAFGDEVVDEGMGAILGTGIVFGVDATLIVCEVIEEVVGGVGEDDAEDAEEGGPKIDAIAQLLPGEQGA